MAVSTYIITVEDFVSRADISQNIQTQKLQAQIAPTQEMFAIKILCRDFYNEVLTHVGGDTSAVITTLMPYLKDYLVYKTYAEYLRTASIMMTPAGARVQTDTTSEPASDTLIGNQISQARERANFYQTQLVNFLTLYQDDYPTWRDSICGCGRRPINLNRFSIVGGTRKKTPIEWT